jgi:Fe-S cluster biogenesis protein NfuA
MNAELRIMAEPIDEGSCRFVVSAPLLEGGVRHFGSPDEAAGSPLAEHLFAIEGVTEVLVSGSTVTVTKSTAEPWQVVGKQIGGAIRSALAKGLPPVVARAAEGAAASDDELYSRVADVFEARVNPMVAMHGGRVDLIDVQDAVVMLRMAGGCQGCGMATVTLRQGVEAILRETVPEVKGIVDITDHSAGSNPYFAASKK